jgi:hypothetical protein
MNDALSANDKDELRKNTLAMMAAVIFAAFRDREPSDELDMKLAANGARKLYYITRQT